MAEKRRQTPSRFEFRVFGQELETVEKAIQKCAPCESIEDIDDLYFLADGCVESNVKIRNECLGLKRLIATENRLELWQPAGKIEFPAASAEAAKLVSEAFLLRPMDIPDMTVTADDFVERIARAHPSILVAEVSKRRFHFRIQNCMVEIVEMLVNGAAIGSIGIESEKPEEVEKLLQEIGLGRQENVSYPRAIGRIMGLLPLPQRNRTRVGGC